MISLRQLIVQQYDKNVQSLFKHLFWNLSNIKKEIIIPLKSVLKPLSLLAKTYKGNKRDQIILIDRWKFQQIFNIFFSFFQRTPKTWVKVISLALSSNNLGVVSLLATRKSNEFNKSCLFVTEEILYGITAVSDQGS